MSKYLEAGEGIFYPAEDHCDICGLGLTTKETDEQRASSTKICGICVEERKSAGR